MSSRRVVGRPFIKVPFSIMEEPMWRHHHALARWLRATVDADIARRSRRRQPLPDRDWQAILAAFGHRCAYCGTDGPLAQEHRLPLFLGGLTVPENIVPACKSCNSRKGVSHPDKWPLLIEPGL